MVAVRVVAGRRVLWVVVAAECGIRHEQVFEPFTAICGERLISTRSRGSVPAEARLRRTVLADQTDPHSTDCPSRDPGRPTEVSLRIGERGAECRAVLHAAWRRS